MADRIVPHFHNTPGVPVIEIGAREFMCVGEMPPFDHPHVFLDMGDATEIICPYCSTLFRHDRRPRSPCGAPAGMCACARREPADRAVDRGVAAVASSRTVIIAGAGIGGLTAALAIAAGGFRVAMFEQAERLEEVGAGIQLSPNASRILIALGLGEQLKRLRRRARGAAG